MMYVRAKYITLALLVVLIGGALLWMRPGMSPVQPGSSAGFWKRACDVSLSPESADERGGVYLPRDGWFIYYEQWIHDQPLYRVREAVALADFGKVTRQLDLAVTEGTARDFVLVGYAAWRGHAEGTRSDAAALLYELREAKLAKFKAEDPDLYEYVLSEEAAFAERWARFQRYPLTLLFEFVFLNGLVVFVAWPGLRRSGRWPWSIQLGLAPMIFFLPYFLGYAELTFTSRGPSGGILYPWLISPFRDLHGLWGDLDVIVLQAVPRALEPLAQPIGPPLALTGMGYVGPMTVASVSVVLMLTVFLVGTAVKRVGKYRGRRREFPVASITKPLNVGPVGQRRARRAHRPK